MLRWLPENVSSFGADVDGLMALIFWIVGVWLVIVEAVLIYFVLAYRRKPGRRAAYVPARGLKTLSWVLVPCAAIIVPSMFLASFLNRCLIETIAINPTPPQVWKCTCRTPGNFCLRNAKQDASIGIIFNI